MVVALSDLAARTQPDLGANQEGSPNLRANGEKANDRGCPAANQTASNVISGDINKVRPLADFLTDFEVALLADSFRVASRNWWLKRAEDFENAKPRPGEFHGQKTRAELSAHWRHCDEVARACRAKAALVTLSEEFAELARDVSWRGAA